MARRHVRVRGRRREREFARVSGTAGPSPAEPLHPLQTLQRAIGNEAVTGLLEHEVPAPVTVAGAKAGPEPAEPEPAGAEPDRAPWRVPPGPMAVCGHVCGTNEEAWAVVQAIANLSHGYAGVLAGSSDVGAQLREASHDVADISRLLVPAGADDAAWERAPTADAAAFLDAWAQHYLGLLSDAMYLVRGREGDPLEPLRHAPKRDRVEAMEEKVAEALHDAYRRGDEDAIGQFRGTLEALSEYQASIDDVVTWAGRATSLFGAAGDLLEVVSGGSEVLGDAIDKVLRVVTAADALLTLVEADTSAVEAFRADLDLIDLGMAFTTAVPLLGGVWSTYISPLTSAVLRGIQHLEGLAERQAREWAAFDWASVAWDEPPRIPEDALSRFPGGQPLFDFMWRVMNDRDPVVTTSVERYFAANADRFNAGVGEQEELETERSDSPLESWPWLSPSDRAPNLLGWVLAHRHEVWAMLYGSLTYGP